MKGDYEEFHASKAARKQSQTKPISRPKPLSKGAHENLNRVEYKKERKDADNKSRS